MFLYGLKGVFVGSMKYKDALRGTYLSRQSFCNNQCKVIVFASQSDNII